MNAQGELVAITEHIFVFHSREKRLRVEQGFNRAKRLLDSKKRAKPDTILIVAISLFDRMSFPWCNKAW